MEKALALDTFSAFFVRHYTEQMSIVLDESKRHIHDKIWHMDTDDLDWQNARESDFLFFFLRSDRTQESPVFMRLILDLNWTDQHNYFIETYFWISLFTDDICWFLFLSNERYPSHWQIHSSRSLRFHFQWNLWRRKTRCLSLSLCVLLFVWTSDVIGQKKRWWSNDIVENGNENKERVTGAKGHCLKRANEWQWPSFSAIDISFLLHLI